MFSYGSMDNPGDTTRASISLFDDGRGGDGKERLREGRRVQSKEP